MKTPTIQQFKKFCRDHYSLAHAVCEAMAFAQCERERVNAYILPLFREWDFRDDEGKPIADPKNLYRCNDEGYCTAFFKACDEAHRKHGFKGADGHCPALEAEHLQIIAEGHLLKAGGELMGFDPMMIWGENRRKMLDLLIGACLKSDRKAA